MDKSPNQERWERSWLFAGAKSKAGHLETSALLLNLNSLYPGLRLRPKLMN